MYVKQILNRELLDTLDKQKTGPKTDCNRMYDVRLDARKRARRRRETHIRVDIIKNIERDAVLEAVIRPLQIKMKEMLNSPHTRRGKAFIENQISWAFGEEN
tara:strand:- start:4900 stop:5205 length:306 start_codon:yes stop_codon:yes gene_type:complete